VSARTRKAAHKERTELFEADQNESIDLHLSYKCMYGTLDKTMHRLCGIVAGAGERS
jgi:hypothetical protein